jgi:adenosine kinase
VKILVNGSMAYDVLLGYDSAFRDGLDLKQDKITAIFLTSHYARHHGGTAANIAWGLNLLGVDSLMVSTVGSDGAPYKELLRERGIDVTYVEQLDSNVTSTAIIGTDSSTNQLGFFHAGADANGTWPDLTQDRDDLSYAIVSPREERLMMESISFCKKYSVPYLFDPGQRITSMGDDDLRRSIQGAYALIANEYEWGVIGSRLSLTEETITTLTPRLIVTQAEHGATCFEKDGAQTVGPCKAEQLINPTGAGDAFRAGLLAGLNANWSMLHSLRLGNAMGSLAVEIEGTLIDHVDRDAVWSRAHMTYDETLPSL